jgi:proteasome lid subunit RPN8/RPN11
MLVIPSACYEEMIAHCRAEYPNEGCGILGGVGGVVRRVFPMTNVERSPVSFLMDPAEQLVVMKALRKDELELVGIFHSHVAGQASPSRTDVELAFYPEAVYVIVSLARQERPVVKGYRIVEGRIVEELIERSGT